MSIMMIHVSITFNKMNRIIRDMSKKIGKEVNVYIIGEETEINKNIIESISDPLMHYNVFENNSYSSCRNTPEHIAIGNALLIVKMLNILLLACFNFI
jgi:two-component system, chemotaxis family, sensor kinase CheA